MKALFTMLRGLQQRKHKYTRLEIVLLSALTRLLQLVQPY